MKIIASIIGGMVAGVALAMLAFAWLGDLTPGHVITGALAGLFCSHPMNRNRTWQKDALISSIVVAAVTLLLVIIDSATPVSPYGTVVFAAYALLSGSVLGAGTYLGFRFVSSADKV